jgi:ribonucleoside-diphosphate reductase alpha chain
VSRTINRPSDATLAAITELYLDAHHLGLKGITIYRYGSIAERVLRVGIGEEPYEKEQPPTCDPYQCKL